MNRDTLLLRRIRWTTLFFMAGLALSGITAIPLLQELRLLVSWLGLEGQSSVSANTELARWLLHVHESLVATAQSYPILFYGTDWLAFGHIAIAVAFVGALRDPVRNHWLFDFGLLACAMVIPWAFFFGALRGIPWWWRLIDCSFGVLGALPLWFCKKWAKQIENGRTRVVTESRTANMK